VPVLQAERQAVSEALSAVTRITKVLWRESHTVLFGSQATNLALPGSDLDIVVLGVSENITNAASGFSKYAVKPALHIEQTCWVTHVTMLLFRTGDLV